MIDQTAASLSFAMFRTLSDDSRFVGNDVGRRWESTGYIRLKIRYCWPLSSIVGSTVDCGFVSRCERVKAPWRSPLTVGPGGCMYTIVLRPL